MTPRAIYSKSGKGVQEASGKTSNLSRADRAVLAAFDGRVTVGEVAERVGKPFDPKFEQLVQQLEKDGYIREVSSGETAAPARPAPVRPAAPARPGGGAPGADLDFTAMIPTIKPSAPSGQQVDLAAKARAEAERAARKAKEEEAISYKARQEAEARAKAEAEARAKAAAQARAQAEAAARAKAEADARARADAEAKARAADADRVRAEADAKVKAAKEAALRLAAEAKAKAEAEVHAKLAEERAKAEEAARVRREAEEKAREHAEEKSKEAEDLRKRLEQERKAREEAERKAKEAEERSRKEEEERKRRDEEARKRREEEERRRREEEERRAKEEAERKAREAEERRRKEEEERKRKEEEARRRKEEEERRRREEEERRAKEEAERKAREAEERSRKEEEERRRRDEEDRRRKEEEARRRKEEEERRRREDEERRAKEEARKAREQEERERAEKEREEKAKAERQKAAKPAGGFADSLMADLENFTQRDEQEQKIEAEKEKRAKAERERKEKEEEERREREEADRKARQEVKRAAKEAERQAKETAVHEAEAPSDEDIGITDEDLDLDEVKREEEALGKQARRAARERERGREREQERKEREREKVEKREEAREAPKAFVPPAAPAKIRRPVNWGKPVAMAFFVLLVGAIAAIHFMPISTAEYEKAASDALGVPVKIGTAHLSFVTGVVIKMDKVSVGPARIARAVAHPEVGSLFGPRKVFSSIELQDATIPQSDAGEALFGKARSANFELKRLTATNLKLTGPLSLPALSADVRFGADGEAKSVTLTGPNNLNARLTPSGDSLDFELNTDSFTVPVAPELVLNGFEMKGRADRQGIDVAAWTASLYEGVLNGTAKVAWNGAWSLAGALTVRGVNAAVFAPTLVSEGKLEGSGKFSMSGIEPAKLASRGRLEGNFTIENGALGSIDISRALSTGGRQISGRTPFTRLEAQGVYDKGVVVVRNININAGALTAGAIADISPSGALSGRIVADVKTASQVLRSTISIGGTVQEPQVKN